ncbi:MAG: diacylglycerol kinase family protein [Ruminococcaceae bacterium]|nr:diacylglycerol kinase family protein [Oscillospiraceae bacterium]
MKERFIKQLHSFKFAFKGLLSVFVTESHMRFHLVAALYVIAFGLKFYSLSSAQWAVLSLTIASVFITEIINTAMERLCDTVTKEYNKNIEFIKDVSAGAVLISAICAVAVAFIILFRIDVFRYILFHFTTNIFDLILLILGSAIAVMFIAVKPQDYVPFIKDKLGKIKKEVKEDIQE